MHGKGHFKQQRLDGVIEQMLASAENNKAQNARQKQSGVDLTAGALGRVPYNKLRKGAHGHDLKVELTFRGFTDWKYPIDYPIAVKANKDLT